MNKKIQAHIAVLLGNFFFGSAIVAVKHISPSLMQPLALNVIRVSVALILFWLLFLFKPSKALIDKKDIPLFILCAATGVAINQILFIKGASLTSPIHTSLLALTTPVAITIIAVWLLKEKFTSNKLIGLLLGISGAAILILSKDRVNKSSSMLGDTFVIINAASYAFYLVLVQPLMQRYQPVHVIRWIFLFGAFMIVPIGWNDFTQIKWDGFLWTHWLALSFIVFGATFFAYIFIIYGIANLGSSITGTYIYTQPVFATITSLILFNEHLSLIKILSALLIFAGVYFVNRKKILTTAEGLESLD
jgi:drug/metabolite transporter (DMT)-like permease